jgi:hypothetical protein
MDVRQQDDSADEFRLLALRREIAVAETMLRALRAEIREPAANWAWPRPTMRAPRTSA